jgi:uncharacterized protein YndB with AHSA1/START domain
MPGFTLTALTHAPVEEVWKLLFDPTRFPEWWAGVESVRVDEAGAYTMWPDGYPDFPMPQRLRSDRAEGRVVISCQVSDIDVTWQIGEEAEGSSVTVHVELPVSEAHRIDGQREAITTSLRALSRLAEEAGRPSPPALS